METVFSFQTELPSLSPMKMVGHTGRATRKHLSDIEHDHVSDPLFERFVRLDAGYVASGKETPGRTV